MVDPRGREEVQRIMFRFGMAALAPERLIPRTRTGRVLLGRAIHSIT